MEPSKNLKKLLQTEKVTKIEFDGGKLLINFENDKWVSFNHIINQYDDYSEWDIEGTFEDERYIQSEPLTLESLKQQREVITKKMGKLKL